MYGVAVYGVNIALSNGQPSHDGATRVAYLLMVVEDAVADEGPCTDNVLYLCQSSLIDIGSMAIRTRFVRM